jgi:hypothetical protein
MSLSSQEQQVPIPFEKPYHKPSYLYDVSNNSSIEIIGDEDGKSSSVLGSAVSKFKGYKFELVAGTDNILYKMGKNKNHIFLQICVMPYTGREYFEAQAIRAKKLSHLDFLSRQLHEGNKEAILQQMQLVLNTTPSKAALDRLGQLPQEVLQKKQGEVVVGVYQIIIPSGSMVAVQNFAFKKGSNNYTDLYYILNQQNKKHRKNTKQKFYQVPNVPKAKKISTLKRKGQQLDNDDDATPPQRKKARVQQNGFSEANIERALALSSGYETLKVPEGFEMIKVPNGGWCFYDALYQGLVHLGKDDFEAMIGSGTASDPGLAFAFCKGDANNT